jgi:acyl carrier protein
MEFDQTMETIVTFIKDVASEQNSTEIINEETTLIGDKSLLDSMNLVELCLSLEDKASEAGFEFDWTSENAMSKSKGMFRTVKSLAAEFNKQAKSIE